MTPKEHVAGVIKNLRAVLKENTKLRKESDLLREMVCHKCDNPCCDIECEVHKIATGHLIA
jgi:hypothetical protein